MARKSNILGITVLFGSEVLARCSTAVPNEVADLGKCSQRIRSRPGKEHGCSPATLLHDPASVAFVQVRSTHLDALPTHAIMSVVAKASAESMHSRAGGIAIVSGSTVLLPVCGGRRVKTE